MRQAGYMAATGIYALDHHIDRLAEDHAHAKTIAAALLELSFVGHMLPVETNILIFAVHGDWTPVKFRDYLAKHGIRVMAISLHRSASSPISALPTKWLSIPWKSSVPCPDDR